MTRIIFINGCGSSGKTSIARGIQHLSPEPWLRFGIDLFIDMMPDQYIAFGKNAKEGYFSFIPGRMNEVQPCMWKRAPWETKFLLGCQPWPIFWPTKEII